MGRRVARRQRRQLLHRRHVGSVAVQPRQTRATPKGCAWSIYETYVDGGTRYWAGVWRAGSDAEYYTIDLDLASFNSLATTRHGQGLRLVDIQTYVVNGMRRWGGVWRSGSDAEYYTVDLDAAQLSTLATQRHAQGLTLVSLETYNSGGTKFAGLWRGQYGFIANYYNLGLDTEALTAYTHSRHKSGSRWSRSRSAPATAPPRA